MNEFTKVLTKSDVAYKLISISVNQIDEFPDPDIPFTFSCNDKAYRTFIDRQNRIRGIDLSKWFADNPDLIPKSEIQIFANKETEEYSIEIISFADPPEEDVGIDSDVEIIEDAITLSLEKDLEKFLIIDSNLKSVERDLELYQNQYRIGIGRIDILARDSQNNWVILELKAKKARPADLAQLLAYIGWCQSELGGHQTSVRGLLIASDFDEKIRYAAQLTPTIQLMKYSVHFSFEIL